MKIKNIVTVAALIATAGVLLYPTYIKPKSPPIPIAEVKEMEDTIQIPVQIEGGQVLLDARLGGYPMKFILDTGCSNVKIGSLEYCFLVKQGVVVDPEIEKVTTLNADGEERKAISTKLNVEIGGMTIPNVNIIVGDDNLSLTTPCLLGHEVFEGIGNIQIDYKNKNLIIYR